MRNSSYVQHYTIISSRYSIREFNTGTEPFMVAMIIIIIIINLELWEKSLIKKEVMGQELFISMFDSNTESGPRGGKIYTKKSFQVHVEINGITFSHSQRVEHILSIYSIKLIKRLSSKVSYANGIIYLLINDIWCGSKRSHIRVYSK